ncbi:hypothetical protein [Streptomyces californicus]|uniref:hypothetical protein n=1 Tax=Streptomyces californicus TaxID=67351 RepID=UPI0035E1B497
MTMQIDGEDYEITPAVWDVFTNWYGDKAYRQAGFVAEIEAAVRAQVATETGDTLTVDGVPRRVVATEFWDRGEYDSYFVYVERGLDGESQ